MAKPRKSKETKIISAVIVLILVMISTILEYTGVWDNLEAIIEEKPYVSGTVTGTLADVYFIDVGQGDCSLVVSQGQTMLIDSGEAEYSEKVITTLSELGVTKLDYAVVSHAHSDHMGGMADIIDSITTSNVIISTPSEDSAGTKMYSDFLDSVENSNANVILAEPDYTFTVGMTLCRILSPFNVSSSEENNNSIVMRVKAGETSFLFTGDAEKSVETEIVREYTDLRSTVLKVGHHGSNTSSSADFLEAVAPEIAVISVGKDNTYGHPTEKVLTRLNSFTQSIYRTDKDGMITFSCTEDDYTVKTEK